VAAWFSAMFFNSYLVKNQKIAKNSTTIKAKKAQIWNPRILEIF
jgi:hypothetical protein